jgi:hypothetical protein
LTEIPWSTAESNEDEAGSNEDEHGNKTACGSCCTRRRNDWIGDDCASGFCNACR